MLRAFHHIKRSSKRERLKIFERSIVALRENVRISRTQSSELVKKSAHFFLLLSAGKSFKCWASHTASACKHREMLLRNYALLKFFVPWRNEAVATSFRNLHLLCNPFKAWRAVYFFGLRLRQMERANKMHRNFERKYCVMAKLYTYAAGKKKVRNFRCRSFCKFLKAVLSSWRSVVLEFRRFRELLGYADLCYRNMNARKTFARLAFHANKLKKKRCVASLHRRSCFSCCCAVVVVVAAAAAAAAASDAACACISPRI